MSKLDNFAYDTPSDTLGLAVAFGLLTRQPRRLQHRTSSWRDRPTPLVVTAGMLGVTTAAQASLASRQYRTMTQLEQARAPWTRDIVVAVDDEGMSRSSARIGMVEGQRALIVTPRFFTRPLAVQRRLYRAACRMDSSQPALNFALAAASVIAERTAWHFIVGDRTRLSRRRAYLFSAVEGTRVLALRQLRQAVSTL